MSKSGSVSLIVSAVVSLALLALYRFTELFFHVAIRVEEVVHRNFVLRHPELSFHQPVQYLFIVVMAFVTAWLCLELPRVWSRLAYLAGASFLTLLLSPVLAFCGVLFEPVSGVATILLAGAFGFVLSGTKEGQRRHTLMRYFAGRISTAKYSELVQGKAPVELSGRRELTVLTCRMLNYPELGSQMEPHGLEQMGSLFLRTAAEFLVGKGAYLDACSAEEVRVFFGLLEKGDGHALEGCQAALELRQRLVELEQEMQGKWRRKPVFGVALATGPMTVGLFGFGPFQSYSAVGEAFDFSRRLCALNLVYGSRVLIGARTFAMTKEQMEARPMEMVFAPRMHQISEVYELLAVKGSFSDEEVKARDAFWQGVVSLRKGAYPEAVKLLKKAEIEGREDAPLQYFLERAEAGLRDDKEAVDAKTLSRHARMLTAN